MDYNMVKLYGDKATLIVIYFYLRLKTMLRLKDMLTAILQGIVKIKMKRYLKLFQMSDVIVQKINLLNFNT